MKMEILKIEKLERYRTGQVKARQKAIIKDSNKEIFIQMYNKQDFLEIEGKEIFAKILIVNGTNYIESYLVRN